MRHQQDCTHGWRHGDFVGAHGGIGEVLQRGGLIVPLHIVANQRRKILGAVIPFHAGAADRGVGVVAHDHIYRHAVGVGVVNRHGGVLQSHGAVEQRHHRAAFNLVITVRHGDGRLFVAAGQKLRHLIVAVIDERLVQRFKSRARVGAEVVDLERLDDVDHEVGAGMLDDLARRFGTASTLAGGGLALQGGAGRNGGSGIGAALRGLLRNRGFGLSNQGCRAGGRTLQEITTSNRSLLGFRHRAILLDCFKI